VETRRWYGDDTLTEFMTLHPLDSALQRVMRADEHLADIRQRLAIFIRQHENVIISQFNTNRPQDMVTLIPTQIFAPMSIAIRIGEICYNLRTALEYLVFEPNSIAASLKKRRNFRSKTRLKVSSCG